MQRKDKPLLERLTMGSILNSSLSLSPCAKNSMATSLAICSRGRARTRSWWTERWRVTCILWHLPFFVQATVLWQQRGHWPSSTSTCGVNEYLRGQLVALLIWHTSSSHVPDFNLFPSHLNSSLCFSLFQLTLLLLAREKNSFLRLKTQPQKLKQVLTQCSTYTYLGISCFDILGVHGQVRGEDCPFDHV